MPPLIPARLPALLSRTQSGVFIRNALPYRAADRLARSRRREIARRRPFGLSPYFLGADPSPSLMAISASWSEGHCETAIYGPL